MSRFSWLEGVLLCTGLFLISVYAGNQIYSKLYAQTALQSFWSTPAPSEGQFKVQTSSANSPDFRLWSEKRIKAIGQT